MYCYSRHSHPRKSGSFQKILHTYNSPRLCDHFINTTQTNRSHLSHLLQDGQCLDILSQMILLKRAIAFFILKAKRNCGYRRVVAVRDLCLRATGLGMLKKGSVKGSIITLGIVAATCAIRARATQNDMDNFKYNKRLNLR
jgi:hypothetical protein